MSKGHWTDVPCTCNRRKGEAHQEWCPRRLAILAHLGRNHGRL